MRSAWLGLGGVLVAALVLFLGTNVLYAAALLPDDDPGEMPVLESNLTLNTVNTTRVGSDDPVETAVAVSQVVYPATEAENTPGAVVLIRPDDLPAAMVAASRAQHFPINAPLLHVERDAIPALTRDELLRLKPEGVAADSNVQVYLVGNIGDAVRDEVEDLGYEVRAFIAGDPIALSELLDDWTSTQHGDHENTVAVANLDNLLPAIPSAFWNAHAGDGLVFVTDEGIPETTRRMLERRGSGPWLYLFGDETVISQRTARELAQYGHVTRIPEPDPIGASAFFADFGDSGEDWGWWFESSAREFGWDNGDAGRNAIFANLEGPGGWANALAATTLSHMGKHGPVLIVTRTGVPEEVAAYLNDIQPYPTAPQEQLVNHGWIIGGELTIAWETQARLDLLLEGHLTVEPAS